MTEFDPSFIPLQPQLAVVFCHTFSCKYRRTVPANDANTVIGIRRRRKGRCGAVPRTNRKWSRVIVASEKKAKSQSDHHP